MRTLAVVFILFLAGVIPVQGGQPPLSQLGFAVQRIEVLQVAPDQYIPVPSMIPPNPHIQQSPDERHTLVYKIGPCGPKDCNWVALERRGQSPVMLKPGIWPLWSPTGKYFAFVGRRQPDQSPTQPWHYLTSVYIYQLEPLQFVKEIDVHVRHYAWSPAGDRLAITGTTPDRTSARPLRPPVSVYIAEIQTGVLREVDSVPWMKDPYTGFWWVAEVPGFSWSPDGRFLAWSHVQRTVGHDGIIVDADLFVARADGSARQQLTVTPLVAEQWPRWVAQDRIMTIRGHHRVATPTRSNPIPFLSDRTDEVVLHLTTPRAMMNIRQAAVAQR